MADKAVASTATADKDEVDIPDMTLKDIIEGETERSGIPLVKFIDNVEEYAATFNPPASAEILIGLFSDLMNRYRMYETRLTQKQIRYDEKIPELDKSLQLIRTLASKKESAEEGDGDDESSSTGVVRYSLADNVYANAELDYTTGTVYLWLGANVMLEFTYQEALDFLGEQHGRAVQESSDAKEDIGTVRDQIIMCEVTMSRIFNWSVRKKRAEGTATGVGSSSTK